MSETPASSGSRPPGERASDDPMRGIAIMALGVMVFAVTDGLVKHAATEFEPLQVVLCRYAFHTLFLVPAIITRWSRRRLMVARPDLHIARGLLICMSTMFGTFGISVLPLAELTAIGFSGPLVATLLAIPFLGERVGIRRWTAVIVGFIGVLIVVRPGTSAFNPAALFVIAGASCWGCGFVITRKIGTSDGAPTMLIWTSLVGLVLSSLIVAPFWRWPSAFEWGLLAAMAALNLLSQFMIIWAVAYAPASTIAPMTYLQLVWATVVGYVAFGNLPDRWAIVGALVICASGLYVWHRERVRRLG